MQTGGIVLFSPSDRSSAIAVANRYCDPDGDDYPPANYFQFYSVNNGTYSYKTLRTMVLPTAYVKLVVKDGSCYAYSSHDNKTWTAIGTSTKIKALMEKDDLSIGIYACSGSGGDIIDVTFANVWINSVEVPVLLVDGIDPTLDVTPDVTPEVTPDTTPDTTPEVIPVPTTPSVPSTETGDTNGPNAVLIAGIAIAVIAVAVLVYVFVIKKKK